MASKSIKWKHYSYFQYFLDYSILVIINSFMEEGPLIGTVLQECISRSQTSNQFKASIYKAKLNLYVLKYINNRLLYATDGRSIIACVYPSLQKEASYHPRNSLPSPFYKYQQKESYQYLTFTSSSSALTDQPDPYNPIFFFRNSFTEYCRFKESITALKAPLEVLQLSQFSFSLVNISDTSLYAPVIVLRQTIKPTKSYKNLNFLQLNCIIYERYVREAMIRYRKIDLLKISPCIIADKGFQEQVPAAFQVDHFHNLCQIQQYIRRKSQIIKQNKQAVRLLKSLQGKMARILNNAQTLSTKNVGLQVEESTWMKALSFGVSFIFGEIVEKVIGNYAAASSKLKIKEKAEAILAISDEIKQFFENVLTILFIDYNDIIKKCQSDQDGQIQTVKQIIQKMVEISKSKNKQHESSKVQIFITLYKVVEEIFTTQPYYIHTKMMMDRLKDQDSSLQRLLNFMKNTSDLSLPYKYHAQVKQLLAKSKQKWINFQTNKAVDTLHRALSLVIHNNKEISSLKLSRNNQSDLIFWKSLAKIYFIIGQYRECLAITDKIDFERDFYSVLQAGNCYRELGQLQAAETSYKSALNFNINNKEIIASIRNFLGLINFTKDQLDNALEQFHLAAELCKNNATYKCNVALTYLKKGDLYRGKIQLAQCQDLLNSGFFNQTEGKICKAFIQTIKQCYPYIYDEVFQELVKIKIKEQRSKASSLKYITSLNERERSFYSGIKTYLQNQYKRINMIQTYQNGNISQLFELYVPIIGDALQDKKKLSKILTKPRHFQQKHKLLQIAPLQESYKNLIEIFCCEAVQSSRDLLQKLSPKLILPKWLQKFAPSLSMLNKQMAELEKVIFSQEQDVKIMQRYGSKVAYEVLNNLLSIEKQSQLFLRNESKEKVILYMLRLTRQLLQEDLSLQQEQKAQKNKRLTKLFYNKNLQDQYSHFSDEEIDKILKDNETSSLNESKDHVDVKIDQGAEWYLSSSNNYTVDKYTMFCCFEDEPLPLPLSEPEQSNELSLAIKCEIYKEIHGYYGPKDALIRKLALITYQVPRSYFDTLIKETTTKRGYQRLVKPEIINFLNEQRETFAKELEEIKNKRDEDNMIEMRGGGMNEKNRYIERLILEQARSYYIYDMLCFLLKMGISMSISELKEFIDTRTGQAWDNVRKKMGRMQRDQNCNKGR